MTAISPTDGGAPRDRYWAASCDRTRSITPLSWHSRPSHRPQLLNEPSFRAAVRPGLMTQAPHQPRRKKKTETTRSSRKWITSRKQMEGVFSDERDQIDLTEKINDRSTKNSCQKNNEENHKWKKSKKKSLTHRNENLGQQKKSAIVAGLRPVPCRTGTYRKKNTQDQLACRSFLNSGEECGEAIGNDGLGEIVSSKDGPPPGHTGLRSPRHLGQRVSLPLEYCKDAANKLRDSGESGQGHPDTINTHKVQTLYFNHKQSRTDSGVRQTV